MRIPGIYLEANRKAQAERLFSESVELVTEREIEAAANQGEDKFRRLESDVPSALKTLWRDLQLMIAMLRDYVRGAYRSPPFGSMAAIAAAVIYFASPVDAIPDFLPGFGYLDDAGVLLPCLRMVRGDLDKHQQWLAEFE